MRENKIRSTRLLRFLLMLGATGFAHAAGAPATDDQVAPQPGAIGSIVYVDASRADLRARAQIGAPVLSHLVANMPVRLISKNGEWCEVEVPLDDSRILDARNAASSAPLIRRGFIACEQLGSEPLTLENVEAHFLGRPEPGTALEWQSRGFWIAPSLSRLVRVGAALEDLHLTEERREKEVRGAKPLRFQVPEFEAMKQRLAAGVRITADTYTAPPATTLIDPQLSYAPMQSAANRTAMPDIKPSLFKANETPLIVPSDRFGERSYTRTLAMIDSLAVANDAPYRAVVTGPAYYALNDRLHELADTTGEFMQVNSPMEIIIGVWDVARLRAIYGRDALLHGVTLRGEPLRQIVESVDVHLYGFGTYCLGQPIRMQRRPVTGYAILPSAAVTWVGKPMPGGPSTRALLKTGKITGLKKYDQVNTYEFDLDRDGVADLLLWQGLYERQARAEGVWNAVFGNVGGEWRLLAYVQSPDCS